MFTLVESGNCSCKSVSVNQLLLAYTGGPNHMKSFTNFSLVILVITYKILRKDL